MAPQTFRIVAMVMNSKGTEGCRRCVVIVTSLVMVGLGTVACDAGGDSSDATRGVTPIAKATSVRSSTPTPSADVPKLVKVSATPVPGTKQDALFLEAKKVYETYLEQIYKLEVGDGVNSVSAELQGILSEDGTEAIRKAYSEAKSRGHRVLPVKTPFSSVTVNRVSKGDDSEIAIIGCADISNWRFVNPKDGTLTPGRMRKDELSMRRIGDSLKIVEAESAEVASCRV